MFTKKGDLNMDGFVQIWAGVLGAVAILMVNSRKDHLMKWGAVVGLVSQPAWIIGTLTAAQWGYFAVSIVVTFSWMFGIYNGFVKNSKEEKPTQEVRVVMGKATRSLFGKDRRRGKPPRLKTVEIS